MRPPWITLLIATLACGKPAEPAEPTAIVSVQWDGIMKGELRAQGEARWCASDSLLEVVAIDGHVGFGFSLLVPDSVRATAYPVVAATVKANWRPLGLAGLRWASDTALKGYEATGGNIVVTAVDSTGVTGTLDLRLKLSDGLDTLRLGGDFSRLRVEPAAPICGRMSKRRGR